jgi:hypothetical protein
VIGIVTLRVFWQNTQLNCFGLSKRVALAVLLQYSQITSSGMNFISLHCVYRHRRLVFCDDIGLFLVGLTSDLGMLQQLWVMSIHKVYHDGLFLTMSYSDASTHTL